MQGAMAEHGEAGELYNGSLISMLEVVWGEGWLSPGGPGEVAHILEGLDLRGKSILDIGCGVGGIDFLLVEDYGAGFVLGIDVEDTVLTTARQRAEAKGLAHRTGFAKVWPGPLPFPPATFEVVFSKDAIVHVPGKEALMADIWRVLKPGGFFAASDWLIGHDGEPSAEMKEYVAAEGLAFGMASPARYRAAMEQAGFAGIAVTSRNGWYRETARQELAAMKGPLYGKAVGELGKDFVDHNIDIWSKMLIVLDKGEHCPTHLRARKPESIS
jgi:ubiquinone/menaquinone biosynthesis C-methylase UbiE